MENNFPAPPPPPTKRRQSILKSGNSVRYEDTECIDITASVLTGLQKCEVAAAAPPPPRRVSFFDVPQVLDISPAHMSSDSHNQDSVDEMNKTFACNAPMEMSSHFHETNKTFTTYNTPMEMSITTNRTFAYNAPMEMSQMSSTNRTISCNMPMEMSNNNETNRTVAYNMPMEMSVVGQGNPALSTSTCYEAMDMSYDDLYIDTESITATADMSREDTAHAHAVTKNIPADMSCVDTTHGVTKMFAVDMSCEGEDADATHGITKNIPVDMSCDEVQAAHGTTKMYAVDMSCTNVTHAHCLHEATKNNAVDMSFEDSVSENLDRNHNPASESLHTLFETSLKPAPLPAQQQVPVRLVHPSEITGRPNVLPSKYQPPRLAQMNDARTQNLVADNSQNVDFLLRYPGSNTAQKCSYPTPTDGYGQFGSAKTPRKGRQPQSQPPQRYQAPVAMASQSHPQHQFPQPFIQKVFLSSVEVQTSPLTTYISTGTSITPKTPQQKTPRTFLLKRDFQQQTSKNSTPEVLPQPVSTASEEKEELQVLAPAAMPPRNQELPSASVSRSQSHGYGQESEHQHQVKSQSQATQLQPKSSADPTEIRRANQRRRETYTVQNSVFPVPNIEIDGANQNSMPDCGIADTSNLSFASTLSSEPDPGDQAPNPGLDDTQDTHQFEGRLVQQQQKSMNTTTIIGGSRSAIDDIDKTEKSIEEVRRSLESALNSTENGNGGLTREILPRRFPVPGREYYDHDHQDQSNTTFNVNNNTTLTHETLLGPGPGAIRNAIFDRSLSAAYQGQAQAMTSAINANMNLSQANGFGLTEEVLPPHLTVNNGGNITFRAESTTTITQETSFVVSGHQQQQRREEQRPITVAAATPAQATAVGVVPTSSTNDRSARDLMPPPTPRGLPTITAPCAAGLPMTPQPKSNSSIPPSMGLGPPSAKKRNLDLSMSICRDPQELCFLAWESHLGQKTRQYLKNYGTMSDCAKTRFCALMREELLKLNRIDFEKFAVDFAHAFPEWFMPTVRSHFEVQELAAIPLHEYDTHPTIVNITGGPEVLRTQTLEEVLASLNLVL